MNSKYEKKEAKNGLFIAQVPKKMRNPKIFFGKILLQG